MNIYDTLTEFNNNLSFRSKKTTLLDVINKLIIYEQILNKHNTTYIKRKVNTQADINDINKDVIYFDFCEFLYIKNYQHLTDDKKIRSMIKDISTKIMNKFHNFINTREFKPDALTGHPYKLERRTPY